MAKAAMLFCGLVGVVILAGVPTEAMSMCPTLMCIAIQYPDDCRAPSYLVWRGRLCEMCNQCIQPPLVDNNQCPPRPCPRIAYAPQCTGKKYFMWRGQMCPDCDVDTCSMIE